MSLRFKITRIIRNTIGALIALILLILFKNKAINEINNKSILSLYFHKPSPDVFERSIKWLKKNGFSFIDVEKLEYILTGTEKIRNKLVLISFDDGWKDNISLIPIITKYNVPLLIFISTDPVLSGNYWWEYVDESQKKIFNKHSKKNEIKKLSNKERLNIINNLKGKILLRPSVLNIDELMEISKNKLITIGSHSVNHPITTTCTDDELDLEYRMSKENLSKWINNEIKYFSYPNGNYDKRDFIFLEKYNYKLAFATTFGYITKLSNKYALPRYNVNDDGSIIVNKAKMLGLWQSYIPKIFLLNQ